MKSISSIDPEGTRMTSLRLICVGECMYSKEQADKGTGIEIIVARIKKECHVTKSKF
jgi:hypothetical protein